jgi:hypothetical protein
MSLPTPRNPQHPSPAPPPPPDPAPPPPGAHRVGRPRLQRGDPHHPGDAVGAEHLLPSPREAGAGAGPRGRARAGCKGCPAAQAPGLRAWGAGFQRRPKPRHAHQALPQPPTPVPPTQTHSPPKADQKRAKFFQPEGDHSISRPPPLHAPPQARPKARQVLPVRGRPPHSHPHFTPPTPHPTPAPPQADQKRAKFFQPEGDHLTLLAVYEAWKAAKFSNPWCHENFLQVGCFENEGGGRGALVRHDTASSQPRPTAARMTGPSPPPARLPHTTSRRARSSAPRTCASS